MIKSAPYPTPDLSYLEEIADGDREFIRRIVSLFLHSVPTVVKDLEQHNAYKDYKGLILDCHRLKSSYQMVGMKQAEEMIGIIDNQCRNNENKPDFAKAITEIKGLTEYTVTCLTVYLNNLPEKLH